MTTRRMRNWDRLSDGSYSTRIRFGAKQRQRFKLNVRSDAEADKRSALLIEIATMLTEARHAEHAPVLLKKAAESDAETASGVRKLAGKLSEGHAVVDARKLEGARTTFRMVAERWTSGELAGRFPDHVKTKRTAEADEGRVGRLLDAIGDVPIVSFTIDDADRAMASLPAGLSSSSRRHYAQVIARVLGLAVFPLRLLAASPLPRGWLPRVRASKATAWLYPTEEAALLASRDVPLVLRLFYGLLAREGMRASEALSLRWADVGLQLGAVRLDAN